MTNNTMTLLPILYWILLILSIIGSLAPATWGGGRYLNIGAGTILFVIVGLPLFPIALQ